MWKRAVAIAAVVMVLGFATSGVLGVLANQEDEGACIGCGMPGLAGLVGGPALAAWWYSRQDQP